MCNWGTTADIFHDNGVIPLPTNRKHERSGIATNWIHDIGGTREAPFALRQGMSFSIRAAPETYPVH